MLLALVVRGIDEWWSYLPAGVVGDLHAELGLSYERAGWLIGLLLVGVLLGSPLEVLADHVERRVLVASGGALLCTGLTTYALAPGFAWLAAASLLMGAASSLTVAPIEAAVSELEATHLDRLLGAQHAIAFIGSLFGPGLLALGALTPLGWRGAFAATAAAVALFSAFAATTPLAPGARTTGDASTAAAPAAGVRPAAPSPGGAASPGGAVSPGDAVPTGMEGGGSAVEWGRAIRHWFGDVRAIALHPVVIQLAGIELLIGALDEPLFAFAVARAAHGALPGVEQLLAVGTMAGGIVGSLAVARRGLRGGAALAGAAALLAGTVLLAASASLAPGIVAMTVLGGGMAVVWATVHHRALTVVPGRAGTVSAVMGVVGAPGAAIPIVAGWLADRAGLGAAVAAYVAVAALVVVLCAGLGAAGAAGRGARPRNMDNR